MICMRFITNFLGGLLLTAILAFAPDTSFARGGGGGGGHFGVFHSGFASRGFGAVAHGFHGPIAQAGAGERHEGAWPS
jgi:hypothetical protein